MENKYLARVNELAAIARERALTPEEEAERAELRQAYLKEWKKGFQQVLDNTYIVDEHGTRHKLKKKEEK